MIYIILLYKVKYYIFILCKWSIRHHHLFYIIYTRFNIFLVYLNRIDNEFWLIRYTIVYLILGGSLSYKKIIIIMMLYSVVRCDIDRMFTKYEFFFLMLYYYMYVHTVYTKIFRKWLRRKCIIERRTTCVVFLD